MLDYRSFFLVLALNTLWINVSEVFRYFVFVMPMMREHLSALSQVAPMNLGIFGMWAVWDTILILAVTGGLWISLLQFGVTKRNVFIAASCIWASIFGIFWLAMLNMKLANLEILAVALPLSWVELYLAGLIVYWGMKRIGLD